MAIAGIPVSTSTEMTPEVLDRFYTQDPMHGLAEQFSYVATTGLEESVDLFGEPSKFFMTPSLKQQMKNFFITESYDPQDPKYADPEAINEHIADMGKLFDYDLQGLMEAAPLGAFNPVVGLTFPMHKNLLMTTVFDKGAIPKDVAAGPQFTLTMETRTLYSPDGREIDMFLEQDKIKDVVEAAVPRKDIILALPEDQQTDVLKLLGVTNKTTTTNISRSTRVTKVIIKNVYVLKGAEIYDPTDTDNPIKPATADGVANAVISIPPIHFVASYGQYDYSFQERLDLKVATNAGTTKDVYGNKMVPLEDKEKQIKSITGDKDATGSTFSLLKAKQAKVTKKSIKISWNKVKGAESYVIHGSKCGKKNKYVKFGTDTGTSYTQKKLKKGTYYKYIVVAEGNGKTRAISKTIYIATKGGKFGNHKVVKVKKSKVKLKKGKIAKIKAVAKAASKKLKVKKHRKLSYETSNPKVVKVLKNGKIKAVGKGSCVVYVYAQNGVYKAVKVKVK